MKRLVITAFWKGADPYLLASVLKADGSYNAVAIVAADVSSISYEVFNKDTGASLGSGSLTPVSTYVLNTLSTGDIWTVDDTGFNFAWIADRDLFTASVNHRVVVTLALSSGKNVVITFELLAANPAGD